MAISEAGRLASLRTRLAAFDYHDQLDANSLELVERLFGDLVSTTEVHRRLHYTAVGCYFPYARACHTATGVTPPPRSA